MKRPNYKRANATICFNRLDYWPDRAGGLIIGCSGGLIIGCGEDPVKPELLEGFMPPFGGLIGCGEDPPKPVVLLGGFMPPFAAIPVVADGLSLAVLVPWLIPRKTTNAISKTAAIPTTSPTDRQCPAADQYNADQSWQSSFGTRTLGLLD